MRGWREGTFVYYSAADVHVQRLLTEALFYADHHDGGTAESTPARSTGETSDAQVQH
ncbi:hypothetical protein ACLQ22_31245 [Micromonospora sp. DT178]|uniref:hypothetical protein n=1 Tax=Micromonospora sp. DT178 TaxID=3393436 RepID=UPI003CF56352